MKKSYVLPFAILLLIGAICLAIGLLAPLVTLSTANSSGSIGIIGGADHSTYSFLFWRQSSGLFSALTFLGSAMVLSSAFALLFRRLVSQTCGVVTSLHSLALSSLGSMGLLFAIHTALTSGSSTLRYPYANPTFFACGMLCLVICLGLLLSYLIQWYKRASFRGLLMEALLTILYFPAFFLFNNILINFMWDILKNYI